jgi:hypothetical protein
MFMNIYLFVLSSAELELRRLFGISLSEYPVSLPLLQTSVPTYLSLFQKYNYSDSDVVPTPSYKSCCFELQEKSSNFPSAVFENNLYTNRQKQLDNYSRIANDVGSAKSIPLPSHVKDQFSSPEVPFIITSSVVL